MKKTLLALAVLGAFAGTAAAQSNVSIYGLIDLGISHDNGGVNSVTRIDSGIQSGSRLGFKGSEDLGGGLSANFVLESGLNADNGSLAQGGLMFGRQSWLGLAGHFGAVRFGRQKNSLYIAVADILDPFGNGMAGDMARFFNLDSSRMDNTVNYATPNLSGFSGQVGYGFGEQAGSTAELRKITLLGTYANGPLALALANHQSNNTTVLGGAKKTTLMGGTYNFGAIKAHAGYARNKNDTTAGVVLDSRDLMLGVSAPIGGTDTVLASYLRKNNKLVANADSRQLAVGYTHTVSKRTNLYTSYSRTSNDAGAKINAGANGKSDNLYDFGVRHSF